jgi:uncharacterized protein involved in outer membrane biogenesis
MKVFKKLILLILCLPIATAIIGYFYFDIIIKRTIEIYGTDILGVSVSVGDIHTSFKDGTIVLSNINISNPQGFVTPNMFEIGHIKVILDIRSIFSSVVKIYNVQILKPVLIYEIGPNGDNISMLRKYVHSHNSDISYKPALKDNYEKKVIISNFKIEYARATANLAQLAIKSVNLPNIYMYNIGTSEGGVSFTKVLAKITDEIEMTLKEIKHNLLLQKQLDPINALEALGTVGTKGAATAVDVLKDIGTEDTVKGLGEALKGLF